MVSTSEFKAIERIFREVVELPSNERCEYFRLHNVSPILEREVDTLLAARSKSVDVLHLNIFGAQIEDEADSDGFNLIGQDVGPFRIVSLLGEGGVGCVYLADQTRPIRRRVALKVIKPGMDTKQVLSRFDYERDALALLNHPNIAKVFEAGSTQQQRPYFAMEYVHGAPITAYCDDRSLSIEERLRLFVDVCEAVQHAHQAGIIHRDLKPSNILVTEIDGKAVPKVIDFGIAKAMSRGQSVQTFFTNAGIVLGTPGYMSPEQLEMGAVAVDSRSDVFSLGVILYELLTGHHPIEKDQSPYSLRRFSNEELICLIRPSHRVSSDDLGVARRRGTNVASLCKILRGDLDWIAFKAIESDPTRRFQSVGELAADLGRFLRHESVLAASPSATYRARKFVRRNRGAVAATLALMTTISIGAVLSLWFGITAVSARHEAERKSKTAQAVIEFFITRMLRTSDPWNEPSVEPTLREVLLRASKEIDEFKFDDPLVEAAIRTNIGVALAGRIEFPLAKHHLQRAVDIFRRELGDRHISTLSAINDLQSVIFESGGGIDEPLRLSREALDGLLATVGEEHVETAEALNNVAFYLRVRKSYDEAERLFQRAIAINRRLYGEQHHETRIVMMNYAYMRFLRGDPDGESAMRDVFEGTRSALGEDHPAFLLAAEFLTIPLQTRGDIEGALELEKIVLGVQLRRLGPRNHRVAAIKIRLAELSESLRQFEEAENYLCDSIEVMRDPAIRISPGELGTALERLACFLERRARYDEAESVFLETVREREVVLGPNDQATTNTIKRIIEFYDKWSKPEQAAVWRNRLES